MSKKSLKQFSPDRIAQFETGMWHAYYHHNFVNLLYLLIRLAKEFFDVSYFSAIRMSCYAAFAAADFGLKKGKENETRITKTLTQFYKLICDNSLEKFDYQKTAQLELEWWLIDRYPDRYPVSRDEALAKSMAVIFNVEYLKLSEYAKYKAEAMVIQDNAELHNQEADWKLIESLLQSSYRSLRDAVQ